MAMKLWAVRGALCIAWVGIYHKMGRVNTFPKDNRVVTIQGILQVCSSVIGIQGYTTAYKPGLQGYTGVYREDLNGIQGYARVYKGIQGYTRVYKSNTRLTRLYKSLQGYKEVYKGIQGLKG